MEPVTLMKLLDAWGKNQSWLARQIDCTTQAVSQWVNGKGNPEPIFAERIAKLFGVIHTTVDGHMVYIPDNATTRRKLTRLTSKYLQDKAAKGEI